MGLFKSKKITSATLGLEVKIAPTIKGQTSGTLSHWLMPYKEERGKVSFQCRTLKPKKRLQVQHLIFEAKIAPTLIISMNCLYYFK